MKAVVVDKNGRNAIVLSKDGQFIKMRNSKRLQIGIEVDIPSLEMHRPYRVMMKAVATAAAFAFTIGIGYGAYSYSVPFSYIDVDINPSVELIANRFDRILKVEAINNDGAKILENQNYKNKSVGFAVEEIIRNASEKGYMKEDVSNSVMLTVSSKNDKKAKEVEKKLQESAKSEMDSSGVVADIIVENVSIERHDEARKLNISPGKLVLIEKLKDVSPDTKIEDYRDSPVKDIMEAINDQKKEEKIVEKIDEKKEEKIEEKIDEKIKEKEQKVKDESNVEEKNKNNGSVENNKTNDEKKMRVLVILKLIKR